jgi:hypothetical protein
LRLDLPRDVGNRLGVRSDQVVVELGLVDGDDPGGAVLTQRLGDRAVRRPEQERDRIAETTRDREQLECRLADVFVGPLDKNQNLGPWSPLSGG